MEWSLRDYGIPPSVWGGDLECKHEFILEIVKGEGYTSSKRWQHKESRETNPEGWSTEISEIGFCSKCGAWQGTLGLEPNFEMFITHLCDIYDGVKRVLKKSGTCWVNLGDSYGSGKGDDAKYNNGVRKNKSPVRGFQKCLLMLPQRFAIEMINRGWILRNVIIWHKPNAMPSSARDRFTVDFEYVYFFVKNKKYWFEQQREPQQRNSIKRASYGYNFNENTKAGTGSQSGRKKEVERKGAFVYFPNTSLGKNKRTVWTIPTKPNPEAHFATFPPKLVEPMIKSGCPEFVCKVCGKPREKIIERTRQLEPHRKVIGLGPKSLQKGGTLHHNIFDELKGFTDCGCETPYTPAGSTIENRYKPGVVLDIFAGSGTTLKESWRLGRNYIGFELSKEYCEIANRLLKSTKNKRLDDFL